MLTSVWGPAIWHFLHTISFNYPVEPTPENKKQYRDFVLSLVHVLPCRYCRENLGKNFEKAPLLEEYMESRASFSKYIYDLHEVVNTMLGKKSGLSYDDVRERYEHFRARCKSKTAHSGGGGGVGRRRTRRKRRHELGCTEPIVKQKKLRCVLKIIPKNTKCPTFQMSRKCFTCKNKK